MLKSPKAKGSRLERQVAKTLREAGLDKDAKRMPLSGAFDTLKSDIFTSLPLSIEVKNQETWQPLAYYEQACSGAKQHETPVVVMAKNHVKPLAMLSLDDFVNILIFAKQGGWTQELSYSKRTQVGKRGK